MAIPTKESIQQGIDKLLKDIQTTGVTQGGKQILAPGSLATTPTGQITPQISPIAADKLGAQENPIIIPPPTPKADTSSAFVTGIEEAQKQIAKNVELATPPPTPEAKEQKTMLARLKELIPGLAGKQEALLAKETELGVPEQRKQLATIQGQVASKIAEFRAVEADYMKAVEATERVPGTTTGIVAGQQRQLARDLAIQRTANAASVGVLIAEANMLQGNVNAAQENIDRAISFKYQGIQDEIEIRLQQLALIEPELNRQEKIRSNAIQTYLTSQQTAINDAKAQEKQKASTLLSWMSDYIDAGINLNDSLEQAQQKIITKSAKYKAQIAKQQVPIPRVVTKPATAAQQTLSGYAVRIEQSNPILKNLERDISGMSYLNYKLQSMLPSSFQSSNFQQYNQASRNFINAVLRRESGAAIAQSEFDNAQKQYLPMPGDSEATLRQKEQNRNLIFANFRQGSGTAYSSVEELLGEQAIPVGETETYVTPDGIEYVKGEDGLYYPK